MIYTPDDWKTMAKTIWGEARGEPYEGQIAVAWVIKNRALQPSWWGKTIEEVCLKPLQFSCWNIDDPNRSKLLYLAPTDPTFLQCLGISALVLVHRLPDYSQGATHYHANGVSPGWAKTLVPTATIGHHKFYKEVV